MNSFNLRDAGLSDMAASRSRQLLSAPEAYVPSWRIYMFRNGEMSVVQAELQSTFCAWQVHGSGEDGGFPSIQTEGPVQREVTVIHSLR